MPKIALKLSPLDVLFFRDSRPFGQADSAFSGLPTPQTFHGLIKTYLARYSQLPFNKIHGLRRNDDPNRWISDVETCGAWLYRQGQVLVRLPSNIVQLGKRGDRFRVLRPLDPNVELPGWDIADRRPLWYPEEPGDETPRAASGFLDLDRLQRFLTDANGTHQWTRSDLIGDESLYSFESRVGIGIDPQSKVASDGQIYSASFMRLKQGVAFYGEVSLAVDDQFARLEKAFANPVVLPWGGEGRQVQVERCNPVDWPTPPELEPNAQLVSVLITPGIFGSRDMSGKNGGGQNALPAWRPAGIGSLRAASVTKPMPISGWSLSGSAMEDNPQASSHEGRPKPTRYAAPPGSVYFWQIGANNRSAQNGRQIKPIEPLCTKPLDIAAGWGMSVTGRWNCYQP